MKALVEIRRMTYTADLPLFSPEGDSFRLIKRAKTLNVTYIRILGLLEIYVKGLYGIRINTKHFSLRVGAR
jgi:hypothetical protein